MPYYNPSKKSPRKNDGDKSRDENFPIEKSYDSDKNLHRPYEGYDEKKTSNNPTYKNDDDADENMNARFGEYSDWNRGGR